MRDTNIGLLVLLAGMLLGSTATMSGEEDPYKKDLEALVAGNNHLAFKFYSILKEQPGNHCFVPLNVYGALSLLLAGAKDETAEQIAKVLKAKTGDERRHVAWGKLTAGLKTWPLMEISTVGVSPFEVSIPMSLWLQSGETFSRNFTEIATKSYSATLRNVDFAKAPEMAVNEINQWVAQVTNNRINDALEKNSIKDTAFIFSACLYLRLAFLMRFSPEETKPAEFHLSNGKNIQVHFMNMEDKFAFWAGEEAKVLAMQDESRSYQWLFVLPKDGTKLRVVEDGLTQEKLDGWLEKLKLFEVSISIPKFEFKRKYDTKGLLSSFGVNALFDPTRADLSDAIGRKGLFVGSAEQNVFVRMDEKGMELATSVCIDTKCVLEHAEFKADRPFLLILRSLQNKTVIFIGRIADPSEKADVGNPAPGQ